jgi:regulator of protease activity HflC (stomatin/prohibitin superfamily)
MKQLKNLWENIQGWSKDKMQIFVGISIISILIILFLWPLMVITVHSGQAAVLYLRFFGGTVVDRVYPEGIYLIAPWDKLYIYDVRLRTVLHEFTFLTSKGLPITLKFAIRFTPEVEMLGLLHQQVGPDYLDKIIIPETESLIRRYVGNLSPEDIYSNKDNILTTIASAALDEISQNYVMVDDFIIRSVELPPTIAKAIEDKLVHEQEQKAYEFRMEKEKLEAERKRIEATGIKDYHEIIARNLDNDLLRWEAIKATLELAKSDNTKVFIMGSEQNGGIPFVFNPNKLGPDKIKVK